MASTELSTMIVLATLIPSWCKTSPKRTAMTTNMAYKRTNSTTARPVTDKVCVRAHLTSLQCGQDHQQEGKVFRDVSDSCGYHGMEHRLASARNLLHLHHAVMQSVFGHHHSPVDEQHKQI